MARFHKASDATVRRVLTALCERDPETEMRALRYLGALEARTAAEVASKKRKVEEEPPEINLCKNCGETFVDDGRDARAPPCCSHPGTLVPCNDSGVWFGWDENARGPIDTEHNRKKYARYFIWDCCNQPADGDKGCSYDIHVAATPKRRMQNTVPRVQTCGNCSEAFLERDNDGGSCWYHPGHLNVDYEADVWTDWYDNDGDLDTEHNRREYPDGFKWDCCGGQGEGDKGCKRGRHVVKQSSSKISKMQMAVMARGY
ncbi:hypothetical protein BR93DRAFT_966919 [Coniochaeta sp. PMI_546]|nr:hypothetical protein BR93DRAFT_966919 [Coniochaeta sp. PMI_546]